uniref:Putative pentatricopeptide repeat-containing protein n=1 Tax=Davidia involucrata TaxID=16924 RepID=A0A5B6ZC41_DAVIN
MVLIFLLCTAISMNNLILGKCIHAFIITSGHTADRFLTNNNLITMYSKNFSLSYARHLFDQDPEQDHLELKIERSIALVPTDWIDVMLVADHFPKLGSTPCSSMMPEVMVMIDH